MRFDAGMCRFVNQPLLAQGDFASSVTGLTLLRMETSKLFERCDFLRLLLRSGSKKLLYFRCGWCFGVEIAGDTETTGVGTSLIRFISVAEEANDESKEIRSVLVLPVGFLEGLGARVTQGDVNMQGFSDARRIDCGIGVRVVEMKSENLLLE